MKKNLENEFMIEKTKREIEAIKQEWIDFKYDELRERKKDKSE